MTAVNHFVDLGDNKITVYKLSNCSNSSTKNGFVCHISSLQFLGLIQAGVIHELSSPFVRQDNSYILLAFQLIFISLICQRFTTATPFINILTCVVIGQMSLEIEVTSFSSVACFVIMLKSCIDVVNHLCILNNVSTNMTCPPRRSPLLPSETKCHKK